ncbi:hypothetical protein NEOKW01_0333 [Nematocida sp. AWRm80]|nr:hypothetical protein NEOKW01_0333 [Nematocida sp. AWRm80]
MFDTFTIRTIPQSKSAFTTEKSFSLLKLFSPDPFHLLHADEFVLWVLLTLLLCLVYYAYRICQKRIKRLVTRKKMYNLSSKEASVATSQPKEAF